MKDKINELNKEYNKYSNSIVKLLNESLKEGEYFLFKKLEKGSYGLVFSREREELDNISYKTETSKILDILEEKPKHNFIPIKYASEKENN